MKPGKYLILLLLIGFFNTSLSAQDNFRLPSIINDNMVLQQNSNVPLWGCAARGQEIIITASWNREKISVITDRNGKWDITLNTPAAGGPYRIRFQDEEGLNITLRNVKIGEVWLCSGQSNMEMPLRGWMESNQPVLLSEESIAEADYPDISLFTVKRNTSDIPLDDVVGKWEICKPELAKDFSAVGYFFGLSLYKKLKVPIGLIHSSWGGTPAQAWTNEKDLLSLESFKNDNGDINPKQYQEKLRAEHAVKMNVWAKSFGMEVKNNDWSTDNIKTRKWKDNKLPGLWKGTIYDGLNGIVWYRKTVNLPESWKGKDLIIELGPIDEMDVTWFNNEKIGEHWNLSDWVVKRHYSIPARLVKAGENIIAVRVINTGGAGGIYGENDDLRIYPEAEPDKFILLAGLWKSRLEKKISNVNPAPYCDNCADYQLPTVLYNAMINPIVPYTIKGAIWYQGESNRNEPYTYRKLFPAMIKSWRNSWKQGDFPFYFVQIAPYAYGPGENSALVRESQLMSLAVPKTGMAVTMDIGDLKCIHPPDKKTVGERLALWALSKDYEFDNIYYSGPLYKSNKISENSMQLFFNYAENGLLKKGKELTHFLIAGEDKKFYKAEAIIDGNTLIVKSKKVNNPVAVRYAWSDTAEPNLFNKSGLPASSFRTDNWKNIK